MRLWAMRNWIVRGIVVVLAIVPTLHWAFEKSDPYTPAVLNWLTATLGFEVAPWLVLLWALAFGLVLYVVRCRWPRFYGAVEIAIGVFIAESLVTRLLGRPLSFVPQGETATMFFTIIGALYIIVRGLDNFHRSADGRPRPTILWDAGR